MNLTGLQANINTGLLGSSWPDKVINIVIILFLFCLVVAFVLIPITSLILNILDQRRLKRDKRVFLEITPPASSTKTAHATTQLFNAVHSIAANRSFMDALLRRKKVLSFEIVATRKEGIRYIVQLPKEDLFNFKQVIASYLPQTKFRVIKDYLKDREEPVQIGEFKQSDHFAFPLANNERLSEHDPIAYLTGSMSKPNANEFISYQLVVSAASRRKATEVQAKLLAGKDAGLKRSVWRLPFTVIFKLISILTSMVSSVLSTIADEITGSREIKLVSTETKIEKANSEVMSGVHSKLSESLFNVDIRLLAITDNPKRLQGLANTLAMYNVPGYQGLVLRGGFPRRYKLPYRINSFYNRLPSMFTANSSVLSSSELSSLYHFAYGVHGQGEDIASSLSRTLPVPFSIKADSDSGNFDVVLGKNVHHGEETALGLTAAERERHVYIIGGTGSGKTTMLQYSIIQDIKNGKGVALIDPHGDLAETLLKYIPKDRIKDVIYFNPRDIKYPIGLNLLELSKDLDEDDLLIEQDFTTESIISVFRKIFSDDDSGGHRIEHFLRNAIHTAFTVEDATLFTVYKLLTNSSYRRSVINKLEDDSLKDFWKAEFNNAGDYQKVKMSSGVNAKLGRFQRSAVTRRILEQPKSTIDFDDIIQNKNILICNFSKGQIGEDTSSLLGISVLTKLQLAALRRSRIASTDRSPFYLYVDEFQNFATSSFSQVLSEARKYKLFLTIAEQTTSQQQDRRLTEVILANVGTVVCFRTGSTVDEGLMLPLFKPSIKEGEIANLPAYNFYARLMAVKAQKPLSGETLLVEYKGSEIGADRVIKESRRVYAKEYVKQQKLEQQEKKKTITIKSSVEISETTPIG